MRREAWGHKEGKGRKGSEGEKIKTKKEQNQEKINGRVEEQEDEKGIKKRTKSGRGQEEVKAKE